MDQGELSDSSQMKESGGLLIGSVLYLNSTRKPEPRWKQESANKKCPNGIGSWIKHQGNGERAPVAVVITNRGRNRLHTSRKGLVASLQAIYEPRPPRLTLSPKEESPWSGAKLLSYASSSPSSSPVPPRMLARPWQQSGGIHGPETASTKPPLILPKPAQLLAGGNQQAPAETISSSRSRSWCGRATSRVPSKDIVVHPSPTIGDDGGSHAGVGLSVLKHCLPSKTAETTAAPARRLSEPVKTSTEVTVGMVEDTRMRNCLTSPSDVVDNKNMKMSAKGMATFKGLPSYRDHNEDEELQYGPGIVNKLKSRYLSRTLRERPLSESRRPSLRRATSLEDWLDKDLSPIHPPLLEYAAPPAVAGDDSPRVTARPASGRTERPASLNLAASTSELRTSPSSIAPKSMRSMNKARSVDSASNVTWKSVSVNDLVDVPSPAAKPAAIRDVTPVSPKPPVHLPLSKDAIVIVEKEDPVHPLKKNITKQEEKKVVAPVPTSLQSSEASASRPAPALRSRRALAINSRYNVDDGELPPPDTVRQVKRLFESGSSRKPSTRRSQSAGPGIYRVPLSTANKMVGQGEKLDVQRMNQANAKSENLSSARTRKQSDSTAPRIVDFAADSKPVIIAKPSPIGPKPTVIGPKPTCVPPLVSSSPAIITKGGSKDTSASRVGGPSVQRSRAAPLVKPVTIAVVENSQALDDSIEEEEVEEVDNDASQGIKTISQAALDNIRNESTSVKFNFEDKKGYKPASPSNGPLLKKVGIIRPQLKTPLANTTAQDGKQFSREDPVPKVNEVIQMAAPEVLNISAQPTESQAGPPEIIVIRSSTVGTATQPIDLAKTSPVGPPTVKSTDATAPQMTPRAKDGRGSSSIVSTPTSVPLPGKDNLPENPEKLATADFVTPGSQAMKVNTPSVAGPAPSSGSLKEPKKPWHKQPETTTVFNFVNENKKVDHIRNEGGSSSILLYKANDSGIARLPDYIPGESSDFIDDLDFLKRPPSPCNVDFEGANIIIGKSLIRRRTKTNKLSIRFNDAMTKLFEYPSEASLLEDGDQEARDGLSQNASSSLGGVGLASYTPSKVHIETAELGVSRVSVSLPVRSTPAIDVPIHPGPTEDYLKPADESAVLWSTETTSDLLF